MPRLQINGVQVDMGESASLLDAAQQAGATIPTLCYLKEIGPLTSCMLCVVKDLATGRMLPACSAKAVEGMEIDTDGEEVRAARREILTMLLSEHVGDCEGPCARICPASLNIPRMLRYIAAGDPDGAARIANRDLIFPATLGRVCTAPCEKGCRRAIYDAPISIRRLHGEAAEQFLATHVAHNAPATGKPVAIVGAGLAGLSAASICLRDGHACRVFEKESCACPALRSLPPEQLPPHILGAEIESIRQRGAEFVFDREIGVSPSLESLVEEYDAVIVACDMPFSPNPRILPAHEDGMHVRAVANGKIAGRRANAMLCGIADDGKTHRFNSQIGRLHHEEMNSYAIERRQPTQQEPDSEAARCLHCDCLKPVSCKLRQYAEEYGVGLRIKRHMLRPALESIQRSGDVLFEPGKCIKCGLCVEITRAAGTGPGLTFARRGLASHVQVPFAEPLAMGLGEVALQCVRACPTGALGLRNEEETA